MTCRSRRPFMWQDEMTEVREAFRRVAKVKGGGYSGFSMWSADSPTADTLSRNRLRRRQAQFAMELRHLNYKEPPFEAFTHLHNIRGMCNRIKNQETVTERKKKAVDLELRPALLRRPVTASDATHRERGCRNAIEKILRPHSAPLRTPGQVPIQCMSPAPTLLYSIIQKRTRANVHNPRSKSEVEMTPSPVSTCSSRANQNQGSGRISGGLVRTEMVLIRKNENLEISDVKNSSEKTRSCFSDSSMEDEGLFVELQMRHQKHAGYVANKRAGKQSLEIGSGEKKILPIRPKISSFTSLKYPRTSSPRKFLRPNSSQEISRYRPFAAGDCSRYNSKPLIKQEQNSAGMQAKQKVKFAGPSEIFPGHNKCNISRNLQISTRQYSHADVFSNPPPVPEAVEDSHVLVKHSAEPYKDFKNSMLQMIREENLQNRRTELEELFQYYLNLNPAVHRGVLKRVIKDIRVELAAVKPIELQ